MLLGRAYYFRSGKPSKCIPFSGLKALEVYTIFGIDNPGSVYYFQDWKLWKCILFSRLKTLEVYTIFRVENHGSVYYCRNWQPWNSILFSKLKTVEGQTMEGYTERIVHACTVIIVHACTMIVIPVLCPTGLMFGAVEIGESGRRSLPGKQAGLGGRHAPQLTESIE